MYIDTRIASRYDAPTRHVSTNTRIVSRNGASSLRLTHPITLLTAVGFGQPLDPSPATA